MKKKEFRVVIKHFYFKGWNATQVKTELDETYSDSAPCFATVSNWINVLKRGRRSTEDELRPGGQKTATDEENVEKVRKILGTDKRMNIKEIAEALGISLGSVHFILHENLKMKELRAKWLPHLLNQGQKDAPVLALQRNLAKMSNNLSDFWCRFMTVDESRVHHYTPETQEASCQWCAPDEGPPKRVRTTALTGKVMATVF